MAGSGKKIIGSIIRRFLYPHHLYQVIKLQRNRKRTPRVYDDAQLKLYHQILPGDFLHYGYFENPNIKPQDMSLNMIYEAQDQYGVQLVNLVSDTQSPILDVGCGMGGLLRIMNARAYNATGLTPDKNQVKHIRETYPNEVLEMKFEDLPSEKYIQHFGTVITSESLQYLDLSISLPLIDQVLKQGGKWVACDYFKTASAGEKSGHNWEYFTQQLDAAGFKITYQKDITPHILPTISYVYMWATQIGMPVKDFIIEKIQVKSPGIYYAIKESLPAIDEKIKKNIDTVDPKLFAAHKKYILMVIERK
jgi:cyclopropane fatty-acyl-phospholipid synthase-like methyltransferase